MKNKDIYILADRLGMIGHDNKVCNPDEVSCYGSEADEFEGEISKDLVSVINFVTELTTYNDMEMIRTFLIALIMKNGEKK